jgi:hypothetical protein
MPRASRNPPLNIRGCSFLPFYFSLLCPPLLSKTLPIFKKKKSSRAIFIIKNTLTADHLWFNLNSLPQHINSIKIHPIYSFYTHVLPPLHANHYRAKFPPPSTPHLPNISSTDTQFKSASSGIPHFQLFFPFPCYWIYGPLSGKIH